MVALPIDNHQLIVAYCNFKPIVAAQYSRTHVVSNFTSWKMFRFELWCVFVSPGYFNFIKDDCWMKRNVDLAEQRRSSWNWKSTKGREVVRGRNYVNAERMKSEWKIMKTRGKIERNQARKWEKRGERGMSARKWKKKRHKKSILAKVTHSSGQLLLLLLGLLLPLPTTISVNLKLIRLTQQCAAVLCVLMSLCYENFTSCFTHWAATCWTLVCMSHVHVCVQLYACMERVVASSA